MPHKYLIKEFEEFAGSDADAESVMRHVSERIHVHIPRYNWIGFYVVDKNDPTTLVLGPHTGSFAPEAKIAVGEGLCGLAASTGRVMVADNVAEDPRCIHASDLVKSQISVPIMTYGRPAAVFHVESYFLASFKPAQERDFVEACAHIVQKCLEASRTREVVKSEAKSRVVAPSLA